MKELGETIFELLALASRYSKSPVFAKACGKMTPAEARLLEAIYGQQGRVSMGELAGLLHMTGGAVTQVTDKLVRKKYISREHDEHDRRMVFLKITASGRKMAQQYRTCKEDMIKKMCSSMDPDEKPKCSIMLENLVKNLRSVLDE